MTIIHISVPEGLDFAELELARDADGHVSFRWEPIEALCAANGLNSNVFQDGPEDNASALITAWYFAHMQAGGAPDPVQEDIRAEIEAEDRLGGGMSHQPGRA